MALTPLQEDEPPPLRSEVEKALRELKNGKSPGLDEIPAELLKRTETETIDILHKLCTSIWNKKSWPENWTQSEFVVLPKKGDVMQCCNNEPLH